MGQYYYGVLLDVEHKEPVAADYCGKLTEGSKDECKLFMAELYGVQRRVAWAGDYSDIKFKDRENMYSFISSRVLPLPSWGKHTGVKQSARYILNHTKYEMVDITDCDTDLNPLALLCCDPDCRIKGGGDYFFREGFNDVGRWHTDVISTSNVMPVGFKLIPIEFAEWRNGTRIWDWSSIPEMLMGKNSYCSNGPNMHDFVRQLLNYGDARLKWACASIHDIRHEARKWLESLPEPGKVYGAVTKARRILRTSRENVEKMIEVLYPNGSDSTYKVECIKVDGVYARVSREGDRYVFNDMCFVVTENGTYDYWCGTKERAAYKKYYGRMISECRVVGW